MQVIANVLRPVERIQTTFLWKNMSLKLDYVIREYQIKEVLLFYDNPVISASKNVKGGLY